MNNLTRDYIKRRKFSFDSNNIADKSKVRHNKFIIINNFTLSTRIYVRLFLTLMITLVLITLKRFSSGRNCKIDNNKIRHHVFTFLCLTFINSIIQFSNLSKFYFIPSSSFPGASPVDFANLKDLSCVATRVFKRAFTSSTCVLKEITLVGSNQGNYFENVIECSKRTLKTCVATQLKRFV